MTISQSHDSAAAPAVFLHCTDVEISQYITFRRMRSLLKARCGVYDTDSSIGAAHAMFKACMGLLDRW